MTIIRNRTYRREHGAYRIAAEEQTRLPVFVYARSRLAYRTVLTRYRNADRVVLIALPITVLGVYLVCAVNRKAHSVWQDLQLPVIERVKYHRWPLLSPEVVAPQTLEEPLLYGLDAALAEQDHLSGQIVHVGNPL